MVLMQRIDLTGKRFNGLTAIEYVYPSKWLCRCDCGKEVLVSTGNLGKYKSCGCQRSRDLSGMRFGFLTAIKYAVSGIHGKWLCRCDCGKEILVTTDNLTRGHSKSCGCQKGSLVTKSKTRHGKTHSQVYSAWRSMRSRCRNPNNQDYLNYGSRGITVCERWLESFENFYADMGDPPTKDYSIDRKNSNGNYDPDNCQWATELHQQNNKRNNLRFTYEGEAHTLKEWAKLKNLPYSCLQQRITVLKWPFEKAITTALKEA
jgi:hypothetical protein